MSPKKLSKDNKKVNAKEIYFEQEKCDGITKKHVTKSKKIVDDKKYISEIGNLMDLANDAISSKNYDSALDYFNQIIDKYSYFDAYNKKGFLLLEIGEYDAAIDCFNNSLKLTKNNYDAHIGKAITYNTLLENNNNLFYELELFSNLNIACMLNSEAILLKINILINNGMFQEASECVETLPPNLISKNNMDIHLLYVFEMGRLYYYLDNYPLAFYLFYYYVTLNEYNVEVWMLLALISSNLNKYDYALKCFDKVLELDNTFYDILLLKAELLMNLHRKEEAIDCFKKCPNEYISEDYKNLIKFAKNPHYSETEYFGVYKLNYNDYHGFEYVFIYMDNGFKEIYDPDLNELKYKVNQIHYTFKEITYHNAFSSRDYIICYYNFPNLNFGYNKLISSILNNESLEKIDKGKINIDNLLKDKNDIEKRITKSLVNSMTNSLKYAHDKNYTGIFGVLPSKHQGLWVYVDLVKAKYLGWDTIYAESLVELETIVRNNGLLWYVFDYGLKKKSEEEFYRLNE